MPRPITEQELFKLIKYGELQEYSVADARQRMLMIAEKALSSPVSISERAFQALEVVTRKGTRPSAVHIWGRIASILPSVSTLYEELGDGTPLDIPKWQFPNLDPSIHCIDSMDWEWTFHNIFSYGSALTMAAQQAVAKDAIDIEDIVLSIIQSGRNRGSEPYDERPKTSLPFRVIARSLGIVAADKWSEKLGIVANRVQDIFKRIATYDRSFNNQQFIMYHDGQNIRLAPFGLSGSYRLQESPLPDGSLWVARGNIIQPAERFGSDAIAGLEDIINRSAPEKDFQQFFEYHPEFLMALGNYSGIHSQLVLTGETGDRLIPDFFLEKMDTGFCDICDLKRPNQELVRAQKNRSRFRSSVMEAVAQLTCYKDWFDDRAHRAEFERRYGLRAFRPQVVVIIGRRDAFEDEVQRIELEAQLPRSVSLRTYDDVLAGAKRWKSLVS